MTHSHMGSAAWACSCFPAHSQQEHQPHPLPDPAALIRVGSDTQAQLLAGQTNTCFQTHVSLTATVDLKFQTMNFDQASQENFPILKVMGKKDLCPRQGLGFQHRECRSRHFILPGSIFLLRCYIDPGSAHKVLNGIFVEALACSRKEGTGWWESGDGAGSLQPALSQRQGQGHLLPDPFCPIHTSTKTNHQQSWPCLQPVVSQNPLSKTVGCFTRLLQWALPNHCVERGVKPTGMGAGSHHNGLALFCSCSPALLSLSCCLGPAPALILGKVNSLPLAAVVQAIRKKKVNNKDKSFDYGATEFARHREGWGEINVAKPEFPGSTGFPLNRIHTSLPTSANNSGSCQGTGESKGKKHQ